MAEALKSPGQKQDFQRMMSGAMSRKEYTAKYPKAKDSTKKLDSTGVYKNLIKTAKEEIEINEVLKVSGGAGEWIKDFQGSDNPKFAGKSKEQRKQQALAAFYAAKRAGKE